MPVVCPICARRVHNGLDRHQGVELGSWRGGAVRGVTRCQFNLLTWRVERAVAALKGAGLVRAGDWANAAKDLARDGLAARGPNGYLPSATQTHSEYFHSRYWDACWWVPGWVYEVLSARGAPASVRLGLVRHLATRPAHRDALVAAIQAAKLLAGRDVDLGHLLRHPDVID